MTRALVLLGLLFAQPASAELLAVVVGHNGGSASLPTLRYADDDALKLATMLRQLDPHAQVTLLTALDDDSRSRWRGSSWLAIEPTAPTKSAVRSALVTLAEHATADATVIFFYAGHGQSGSLLLDGGEQLTGYELRSWLAAIPAARRFAFVDACRSQSLFTDRGSFASAIAAADEEARATPMALITAATSQSPAGENEQLRAGYFSHVLTSGLIGAADADGDGVVRFDELAAFVTLHTQRFSATRPWFEAPESMLQAPIISVKDAAQGLLFVAGLSARQVVRAADTLIAEAHPGVSSSALRLALPAGLYSVEDFATSPASASSIEVKAGAFTGVDGVSPAASERGTWYPTAESGFEPAFTEQAVRSWSTAYAAGLTGAPTSSSRLVVEVSFFGSSGALLPAFTPGLSLGLAARLNRFEVGALLDAQLADAFAGSERHLGLLARGGVSVLDAWRFTLRLDLLAGSRLWQFTAADGRSGTDPTVPTFGAQASVDLLLAVGFRATLGVRAELALPVVDTTRAPRGAGAVTIGLRWLSPAG